MQLEGNCAAAWLPEHLFTGNAERRTVTVDSLSSSVHSPARGILNFSLVTEVRYGDRDCFCPPCHLKQLSFATLSKLINLLTHTCLIDYFSAQIRAVEADFSG